MPAVNAALNGVASILLVVGLVLIKRKRIAAHRNVMLSACGVSVLFLAGYVAHKIWKAGSGGELHTSFNAEGAARTAYMVILLTHLVLAMLVPFLAVALVWLGFTDRRALHRRIARFAWPIWMYVSVTGVVIYFMLYHFNPSA